VEKHRLEAGDPGEMPVIQRESGAKDRRHLAGIYAEKNTTVICKFSLTKNEAS